MQKLFIAIKRDSLLSSDVIICVELKKKLENVELENKIIRDEFNVQRAKLKEIFLQKEGKSSRFCSLWVLSQ